MSRWPAVIVAGVAMIVAAVMAILHVDKEVIMLIMSLSAVPVIGSLISAQQGQTQGAVQALQVQTNGNTSKMLDLLDRQGQLLAAQYPTAATRTPAAPAVPPVPADPAVPPPVAT